jgi:hypothetical protein
LLVSQDALLACSNKGKFLANDNKMANIYAPYHQKMRPLREEHA